MATDPWREISAPNLPARFVARLARAMIAEYQPCVAKAERSRKSESQPQPELNLARGPRPNRTNRRSSVHHLGDAAEA
jgi:hypothetical protein